MNECPLAVSIETPVAIGICRAFIACRLTGKQCVCCSYCSWENAMVMNHNVEICPGYNNSHLLKHPELVLTEEYVREKVLEWCLPVENRVIAIPSVLPEIDVPIIAAERLSISRREDSRPWQERKRKGPSKSTR